MNVQWLKDGQPVEASSRITSFFNFGYVALTVKQVALHDQGTYSCVASNAAGRAETKAQLRCNGRADAEFQSKSWESVQKMESRKGEGGDLKRDFLTEDCHCVVLTHCHCALTLCTLSH